MSTEVEEQIVEQEMTLLAHRAELEERIRGNILRVLLCDPEKLLFSVVAQLKQDLKEWFKYERKG